MRRAAVKVMLVIKAVLIIFFVWVNIPTSVMIARNIMGVPVYFNSSDTKFFDLFESLGYLSLWIIHETLFGFWPMLLNMILMLCFAAVYFAAAKVEGVEIDKSKSFRAGMVVMSIVTVLSFDTIVFMPGF